MRRMCPGVVHAFDSRAWTKPPSLTWVFSSILTGAGAAHQSVITAPLFSRKRDSAKDGEGRLERDGQLSAVACVGVGESSTSQADQRAVDRA